MVSGIHDTFFLSGIHNTQYSKYLCVMSRIQNIYVWIKYRTKYCGSQHTKVPLSN